MALNAYLALVQSLIQAPSSPIPLVSTATLTSYINIARNEVAANGECIRIGADLPLVAGTQVYSTSAIVIAFPPIASALVIRQAFHQDGTPLDIRSFEWFQQYYLRSGATGVPQRMAQQQYGTGGVGGSLYVDPVPVVAETLAVDVVALPIPLASDATIEAIPFPWTEAVPFYAAWLALMTVQRQADADKMMVRYMELMARGRQESTPTFLPENAAGGMGATRAAAHRAAAIAATKAGG